MTALPKKPETALPKDDPRRKQLPPTPDEQLKAILVEMGETLERLEGCVSEMRTHSVSTHLKGLLRLLGYKPRKEWQEGDWIGLHRQIVASHKQIGEEMPAGREEFTLSVANCILSNLKAETDDLKRSPAALKEAPE